MCRDKTMARNLKKGLLIYPHVLSNDHSHLKWEWMDPHTNLLCAGVVVSWRCELHCCNWGMVEW